MGVHAWENASDRLHTSSISSGEPGEEVPLMREGYGEASSRRGTQCTRLEG